MVPVTFSLSQYACQEFVKDEKHFKRIEVLGSQMAYVDTGEGPVVLFQHGNP